MPSDKIKREFIYKMKPCIVKNCPMINGNNECGDPNLMEPISCCNRFECGIKRLLLIPYNRLRGVQKKLSCCYGYSEDEKRLRYEELNYVIDEMLRELEVENGSGELD